MAGLNVTLDALFRIDGKVAVVTDSGACSSPDVGPVLAAGGAKVVIADKDPKRTEALARSIDPTGTTVVAVPTDIELEDSVVALFRQVQERFGRLDILVNCAGVTANMDLLETPLEIFDAQQSVNQRSTFLLMREGVRAMRASGQGGRIVNVTTMGTLHPVLHGNAAYASSRSGVIGMTRSIAFDYAREGILANTVHPGAVRSKTRFHETLQARLDAGGRLEGPGTDPNRLPLGMGNGQDIAAAVLYLVGPSGGYITGQSIVLDGGFLIS
jgi:meso-butanediol dehydrogenase / (S,S)-butanediol dehydrogenase / diacetyl reductase